MSEAFRILKKKLSQGVMRGGQGPPPEPEQPLPQYQPPQQSQPQTQAQCQMMFGHIMEPEKLEKEVNGQGSPTTPPAQNPPAKATPNNGITPLRPSPKKQLKSSITPAPGQQSQTSFTPGHTSNVSTDIFGINNRK